MRISREIHYDGIILHAETPKENSMLYDLWKSIQGAIVSTSLTVHGLRELHLSATVGANAYRAEDVKPSDPAIRIEEADQTLPSSPFRFDPVDMNEPDYTERAKAFGYSTAITDMLKAGFNAKVLPRESK